MSLQTLVILCFFSLSFLSASPLGNPTTVNPTTGNPTGNPTTQCGTAGQGLLVGNVPPDCQRVLGDLLLSGPNSTSVSLPVLEQVDRSIEGDQSSVTMFLSVPALRSVGKDINFYMSKLRDFNAPQLETVGEDVYLRYNLFLTTFHVPELRTVGRLVEVRLQHNLSAFVAPKLETVSGMIVQGVSSLVSIEFASLTRIDEGLEVTAVSKSMPIRAISMPKLSTVGGYISFKGLSELHNLSLPSLATVGLPSLATVGTCNNMLNIALNDILSLIELPLLRVLQGEFKLQSNPSLRSITLPSLVTSAAIDIYFNTVLESVYFPVYVSSSYLTVKKNQALSVVSLPALESLTGEKDTSNSLGIKASVLIEDNKALSVVALPALESVKSSFWLVDKNEGANITIELYSLRRVGGEFTFDAQDGLCLLCLDLLSVGGRPRGSKERVSSQHLLDFCASPAVARANRSIFGDGKGNNKCEIDCSWKSLGCYPELSKDKDGGHLNCAEAGLQGLLHMNRVDWAKDLPSAFKPVRGIDLSGNLLSGVAADSFTCNKGISQLQTLSLKNNTGLHVSERVKDAFEKGACPQLAVWETADSCAQGSRRVPFVLSSELGVAWVCQSLPGYFIRDDGTVISCGSNFYLDYDTCKPCPPGASSSPGAYSLQSCFKNDVSLENDEPLEEISIVVTAGFGGIALLWVAIILRIRKKYPIANFWVVLPVLVGILDTLTDILFAKYIMSLEPSDLVPAEDLVFIQRVAVAFIVLPMVINTIAMIRLLLREISSNSEFGSWFKNNFSHVAPIALLGVINLASLQILDSKMFGKTYFSGPWSIRSRDVLRFGGILSNLFEDIPQFAIQLYFSILYPSSLVTLLSIIGSSAAILCGVLGRGLLIFIFRRSNSNLVSLTQSEAELRERLHELIHKGIPPEKVKHALAQLSGVDIELKKISKEK